MPYRNNPMVQARIYEARKKKERQIRGAAHIGFVKGVKAGATCARELIAEGFSEVYEFESLVLDRLNLIDADDRILLGSDTERAHYEVLDDAKAQLPVEAPTEEQFVAVSVAGARSAGEAWMLHRELTDIDRDALPDRRRSKLAAAIAVKFPA